MEACTNGFSVKPSINQNRTGATNNNTPSTGPGLPRSPIGTPGGEMPAIPTGPIQVVPLTQVIGQLDGNQVKSYLDYLASDELQGRGTGTPGGDMARDFVAQKFAEIGLTPAGDNGTFLQGFATNQGNSSNVIGVLPGNDPVLANEFVVVGAHYDHLGVMNGQIHNGADDNASGTAAVISIAESFMKSRENKRSVIFMAFGAEELRSVGSQYWVDNPTLPINAVKYMLNLDMIGNGGGGNVELGIIGMQTAQEVNTMMQGLIGGTYSGLNIVDVDSVAGPNTINSAQSDQTSFVNNGIPAMFFTIQQNQVTTYHQPTDTAEKIQNATYIPVVKLATESLMNIANSPSITPGGAVQGASVNSLQITSFLSAAEPDPKYEHGWGCAH